MDPLSVRFFDWHLCYSVGYTAYLKIKSITKMKFSWWMHTLTNNQTTKHQVKNLGVILETDLSFSSHVKAVTKSVYYHLKTLQKLEFDLKKLVHAFITSMVDYCNGLLTGLPKKTIRQLQLIQNAAARILTRTRTSEHFTPALRSLHWLPDSFRIDFKVLLLVYKSLICSIVIVIFYSLFLLLLSMSISLPFM